MLLSAFFFSCQQQYPQGRRIYQTYCANCHMEDGTGLGWLIPPLDGADYLQTSRDHIPCMIRYGSKGGITVNNITFREPMPSFRNLNEVEISNLINYINTAWSNDNPETSPAEVAGMLERCPDK
jgi:mono/diheme cytochrome c family protein